MAKRATEQFHSSKAGIGYITRHADGREIFFKIKSSVDGGPALRPGQAVKFDIDTKGAKGPQAKSGKPF